MAYNKPAVQVYQELINAGGAASINPDLPACIVGPLKHIVETDLSDSISAAESLAGTLAAWTGDYQLTLPSPKSGQVESVDGVTDVVLTNALVVTWEQSVLAADINSNVITLGTNDRGVPGSNGISSALPFAANEAHVELGDYVGISTTGTTLADIEVYTQILSVDEDSSQIIVAPGVITAADSQLFIFKKFNQITPGTLDIDTSAGGDVQLNLGNLSDTYPESPIRGDATDYTFAVESELSTTGASLNAYIGYIADRADTINTIVEITDLTDLQNQFGNVTKDNPLAFGVSLALANSGGAPVYAIAIDPDTGLSEDQAYTKALELAEGRRLYWLALLTNSTSVAGILKSHVNAMSLPSSGNWRVGLTNFAIPDEVYILGQPGISDGDADNIEDGLVTASVQSVNGSEVTMIITSGQMVGNTTAGDLVQVDLDGAGTGAYDEFGSVEAASGFTIVYTHSSSTALPSVGDRVEFYIGRTATRNDQVDAVVGQCNALSDKRMLVFPGDIIVPGTTADDYVEGYYLMCAVAGMGSGFPAQTGFTNITIGGISGLQHGNFYFTEGQLNSMAEAGAFLYVQNAQGTTPYCRHGLTTDVSVLEYREILKVKNWDYLSYYYKDIISPFIGTWNITADTIQNIRQSIVSSSEALISRKLPKVGPPLLSYKIARLEQNANSRDAIDAEIEIAIVDPNNYTNIYLQI